MIAQAVHRSRSSLVALAAAALLAGCGDESAVGPEDPAGDLAPAAAAGAASRAPDLGDCDELRAPEGSKLVFRAYAEGVQIYEWDGGSWAFRGPSAKLYADAGGNGEVGRHYGGPTWESNSGSLVVATLNKACEQGPADIPWLLLDGVRSEGPGIFNGVASIQRVNTAGGRAPSGPGSLGEVRNVPYTAEYYFYGAP
jgi:hypothetical protein